MLRGKTALTVLLLLIVATPSAYATGRAKLIIASDNRTQIEIARDISRLVALPANLKLDVVGVSGPAEALQILQREQNANLAIFPATAPYAYAHAASRGNLDAIQAFAPIRVVAPLYAEEVHFIARADSPYNAIQDIQDARINVGAPKSTTALSVGALYRLLFGRPIAEVQLSGLSYEKALVSLVTDKSVDIVAIIGDQPVKVLAAMKPEARQFIKLLRFDGSHPSSLEVLQVFSETAISASSYKNLLTEDLPGIALTSYLVVHRPRFGTLDPRMGAFAKSWCQNSARIRASGHSKVLVPSFSPMESGDRWPYANSALFAPADCSASAELEAIETCPHEDRGLGLCD